ncbi:MAG: cupin domain-containing protein [Spirochaetales bacterium]|nr:cupin domain-containing protein [Spirochaetales bacterium]
MNKLKAIDVINNLNLIPLEGEGGFFRQTWASEDGTAIYYLVTEDSWSALHILDVNEVWHFYAGDSLKQIQLKPDGTAEVFLIGSKINEGELPQLVCPSGIWQSTRLIDGGSWALVGTTTSPPYNDDSIKFPNIEKLMAEYSGYADLIKDFI